MKTLLIPALFAAFGAILILSACDNDTIPVDPGIIIKDSVSFAADIQPILTADCATCHNPSVQEPDLRAGFAYESLMKLEEGAIKPGDADESELMEMMEWKEGSNNPMPPGGKMTPMHIGLFRKWINEGARNN